MDHNKTKDWWFTIISKQTCKKRGKSRVQQKCLSSGSRVVWSTATAVEWRPYPETDLLSLFGIFRNANISFTISNTEILWLFYYSFTNPKPIIYAVVMKYVDKNCIDFFFNSFKINFGYKICNGWVSKNLLFKNVFQIRFCGKLLCLIQYLIIILTIQTLQVLSHPKKTLALYAQQYLVR